MSYKAFAALKEHVEIETLKTMSYEEINALLNKQKSRIDELEKAGAKAEVFPITDERLQKCLESLTEIQYFYECSHKHRAWAWDALNALSPELARLSRYNAEAAFDRVHGTES